MAKTVQRLVTQDGREPSAPAAAYQVLQDGRPLFTLTTAQLDAIVDAHFKLPTEQ